MNKFDTDSESDDIEIMMKFSDDEKAEIAKFMPYLQPFKGHILNDYEVAVKFIKLSQSLGPQNFEAVTDKGSLDLLEYICSKSGDTGLSLDTAGRALNCDMESFHERMQQTEAHRKESEVVTKAKLKLQHELEVYEPQFTDKAITAVVTGSMYFGDAKPDSDIDLDFYAASEDDIDPMLEKVIEELPEYTEIKMDSAIVRLDAYDVALDQIAHHDYSFLSEDDVVFNMYKARELGGILQGDIIALPGANHEKATTALQKTKEFLLSLCQTDPLIRALMYKYLEEVSIKRLERKTGA